jgi:hypothetical protein
VTLTGAGGELGQAAAEAQRALGLVLLLRLKRHLREVYALSDRRVADATAGSALARNDRVTRIDGRSLDVTLPLATGAPDWPLVTQQLALFKKSLDEDDADGLVPGSATPGRKRGTGTAGDGAVSAGKRRAVGRKSGGAKKTGRGRGKRRGGADSDDSDSAGDVFAESTEDESEADAMDA